MTWRAIEGSVAISKSLAQLSDFSERVWWRILAQTDAWGRLPGDLDKLIALSMPLLAPKPAKVEDALVELEQAGRIVRYTAEGVAVIQVVDFDVHQREATRRRRASVFPDSPANGHSGSFREFPGVSGMVPDDPGVSGSFRVTGQDRTEQDHALSEGPEVLSDHTVSSTSAPAALPPDKPAATVKAIFDHWKAARGKPRAGLTDQRRRKIQARLKRFTPDELRTAIDAVALDPWDERAKFDDLAILFRSDDQVERFLELADRANGQANGASPEAVARNRERAHLDAVAAREGRL